MGSRAAMRSMQSRVTASQVISPAAIFATIWVMPNSLSPRLTLASIAGAQFLPARPAAVPAILPNTVPDISPEPPG